MNFSNLSWKLFLGNSFKLCSNRFTIKKLSLEEIIQLFLNNFPFPSSSRSNNCAISFQEPIFSDANKVPLMNSHFNYSPIKYFMKVLRRVPFASSSESSTSKFLFCGNFPEVFLAYPWRRKGDSTNVRSRAGHIP